MKIKFTVNGKQVSGLQMASDLLHLDSLFEKMLQEKVAGLSCDVHPIQCRHLVIKVAGGKAKLENVCCDDFRQKVMQAIEATTVPRPPQ